MEPAVICLINRTKIHKVFNTKTVKKERKRINDLLELVACGDNEVVIAFSPDLLEDFNFSSDKDVWAQVDNHGELTELRLVSKKLFIQCRVLIKLSERIKGIKR